MTILVVASSRDPHRQAEALRAALGLTLRGARVEVVAAAPPLTALARRLADTLRSFGYPVACPEADAHAETESGEPKLAALGDALARADRVEVWT